MPANEKEIKVRITAKDDASRELESAMDKVKTAAKVAFTAVAGAVALSVNAAANFEKGMTNVYTLVDRNKEAFRDMENDIKVMARNVPVSIDDLTAALYDVRSAGIDAGAAMGVLQNSAKLGVAGLGTTKEAVNLATSAINAFSLKGREADAMFNTMFLTVKAGKTTIAELAQSFGNVAPVAAAAGIKLEELQAATAALTVTGQKASVAQTQLRAAILAIQAPSDAMQKILQKAGITDVEATLKKEGLVKVMGKIKTAADGNTTALKNAYGSVEALGASLSLAGPQGELFNTVLQGMQESLKSTEGPMKDLNEAFEIQKATFSAQAQLIKNQLNTVLIDLGSVIMPILIEKMKVVSETITKLTDWWMGLSAETKAFVGTVAGAIGSFVATAATLVGIATAVVKVKEAMAALNLVMKANPILFVVGLLIALGVALYNLYQNNEEFRKKVDEIWGKVKGTVSGAIKAISDAFTWFKETIVPVFVGAWEWLSEKAGAAIKWLQEKYQAFNDWMKPLWDALWRFYKEVVDPILKWLGQAISDVFGVLKEKFTAMAGVLKPIWGALWEAIKVVVPPVWEVIKGVISGAWKIIEGIFNTIKSVLTTIWNTLWDSITQVVTDARDTIVGIINGITDAITAIPKAVGNAVSSVGNAASNAGSYVAKTASSAYGSVKSFFGFANGGRMSAGDVRTVGEHGPERFMPDVSGTVMPNDQTGGLTVIMNLSNNQFLDRNGAEKIMELAFQKFKMTNKVA